MFSCEKIPAKVEPVYEDVVMMFVLKFKAVCLFRLSVTDDKVDTWLTIFAFVLVIRDDSRFVISAVSCLVWYVFAI
jgi:hypothetical protein